MDFLLTLGKRSAIMLKEKARKGRSTRRVQAFREAPAGERRRAAPGEVVPEPRRGRSRIRCSS